MLILVVVVLEVMSLLLLIVVAEFEVVRKRSTGGTRFRVGRVNTKSCGIIISDIAPLQ